MTKRSSYYQDDHHFNYVSDWRFYSPIMAGSIDATDDTPHDHGIIRAMQANYRPNKNIKGDPNCTIFVGRLSLNTTENTLKQKFDKYGKIKQLRLVRDIVTGFSKGYAFIEYEKESLARKAYHEGKYLVIDDKEVIVDFELERKLEGWKPRRLGGGLSGYKESGQLRFGGRYKTFSKPFELPENLVEIKKKILDKEDKKRRSSSKSKHKKHKKDQ